MSEPLHYDYTISKEYCRILGLVWLGDDWVRDADREAWAVGFTQGQVEVAMRHHLWQVKTLFTPRNYSFWQRILIAAYFLFGFEPKRK